MWYYICLRVKICVYHNRHGLFQSSCFAVVALWNSNGTLVTVQFSYLMLVEVQSV